MINNSRSHNIISKNIYRIIRLTSTRKMHIINWKIYVK